MYICRSLSDDFVMKLYYKECHHRDMTWKPEQSERSLLDSGDLNDVIPGGTRHLIFKRRMYLPWSPIHDEVSNATSVTSTGHMLEYIESVHNVMYAQYPCNKQQVMELAGLMS